MLVFAKGKVLVPVASVDYKLMKGFRELPGFSNFLKILNKK